MKNNNPWLKNSSWQWELKVNADKIIRSLEISRKDIVLDIGCGPGAYLNDIEIKTHAKCYGIDIARHIFKKNRNKKISLIFSDMRDIQFPDNFFTKIFSLGTIEHVPETNKVFSEISRVMKKNGKLFFSVPNKCSFFHITKKIKQFVGLWKLGYEKSFTIKELEKILTKNKFKILQSKIVPHPKVNNLFNLFDNFLNKINNKKFDFFVEILAIKK